MVIGVCFIAVFVPLSWPGIQPNAIIELSRADRTHRTGFGHDFRAAYTYIKAHRLPEEAVFSVDFRSYYWGADSVTVIPLGRDGSLSLKEFKVLLREQQSGWVVWSKGKSHHLTKQVRSFIESQMTNVTQRTPELHNTNMLVYYFRWEDISSE
jgi:hypothetical protein